MYTHIERDIDREREKDTHIGVYIYIYIYIHIHIHIRICVLYRVCTLTVRRCVVIESPNWKIIYH